jgi:hypothetical protein
MVSMDGGEGWKGKVISQTEEAYGLPADEGIRKRDRMLKDVVRCQEGWEQGS